MFYLLFYLIGFGVVYGGLLVLLVRRKRGSWNSTGEEVFLRGAYALVWFAAVPTHMAFIAFSMFAHRIESLQDARRGHTPEPWVYNGWLR